MKLIHLSISDADKFLPVQEVEPSPDECVHTPAPTGYVAWHEWAEKASKTHRAIRCPHCDKWSIWIPKKAKP